MEVQSDQETAKRRLAFQKSYSQEVMIFISNGSKIKLAKIDLT